MVMRDTLKSGAAIGARVKTSSGRAGTIISIESLDLDPRVKVKFDTQAEGEAASIIAPLSLFELTPPVSFGKAV